MKFLRGLFFGFLTAATVAMVIVSAITGRDLAPALLWLGTTLFVSAYGLRLELQIEKNDRTIATARAEYIDHLERQVKFYRGIPWTMSSSVQTERPS